MGAKYAIKDLNSIIGCFISVEKSNFSSHFDSCTEEFRYIEDYWELIEKYNIFNSIDSVDFENLLRQNAHIIRYVLSQHNTVNHFDNEIRRFLLSHAVTDFFRCPSLDRKTCRGWLTYSAVR
jgi:hypothetical protein